MLGGDLNATACHRAHDGMQRLLAFVADQFVDEKAVDQRPGDAIKRAPILGPALHALAVRVPKIRRQLARAGVENIRILQHLVIEIVFRFDTNRAGLDAQIDVLGDQDNFAARHLSLEETHDANDPIVGQALGALTGVDVTGVARSLSGKVDNAIWGEIGREEASIRANPEKTNDAVLIAALRTL